MLRKQAEPPPIVDLHGKAAVAAQRCCGGQGDSLQHREALREVLLSSVRLQKTKSSTKEKQNSCIIE